MIGTDLMVNLKRFLFGFVGEALVSLLRVILNI
jgi:hypothetical protein